MASYRIELKKSAAKEIEKLKNNTTRKQIVDRIQKLAEDLRPPGCEKLSGSEHYRVRQGQYHIVYSVHDDVLLVEIVKVRHRRDEATQLRRVRVSDGLSGLTIRGELMDRSPQAVRCPENRSRFSLRAASPGVQEGRIVRADQSEPLLLVLATRSQGRPQKVDNPQQHTPNHYH